MDENRIRELEAFVGLRIAKAAEGIKQTIRNEFGKRATGDRLVYTAAEVAAQCGLKTGTIRKEIAAGRLEGFVKNNRLLVTAEAFRAWLLIKDEHKPRGNHLENLTRKPVEPVENGTP